MGVPKELTCPVTPFIRQLKKLAVITLLHRNHKHFRTPVIGGVPTPKFFNGQIPTALKLAVNCQSFGMTLW